MRSFHNDYRLYNNTCSIHSRHYTDEKYSVVLLVNILEIYFTNYKLYGGQTINSK